MSGLGKSIALGHANSVAIDGAADRNTTHQDALWRTGRRRTVAHAGDA
ncbi:hypothetical protein HEB94_000226 [Actinopolymorpha pittospori]|uniref:Uncharacterized protein n=1 Tax=Actinopolymorpha pittospori TaxID=648752 RepID=A0A927RHE9_9ACTN|nr:hypothetical protein [Actinopolymorpha pittospori]